MKGNGKVCEVDGKACGEGGEKSVQEGGVEEVAVLNLGQIRGQGSDFGGKSCGKGGARREIGQDGGADGKNVIQLENGR